MAITVPDHYTERSAGVYEHATSPEQRALASFDHVARTGGAWGARLAAVKSRELLEPAPRGYRVRFDRTDPRSVR